MTKKDEVRLSQLMELYNRGVQEVNTRLSRKNGWNDVVNAYMNKLPANWPFLSMVTDPRLRTTLLEKTARLINAKLRGRLVPREGGDMIKAEINNSLLDFQWDMAQTGGSMIEKIAAADQVARLFGSAFVFVYWDVKRNTNEIKLVDPRDIFFDGSATHIKNAKRVQVREWTTFDVLEARGYKVSKAKQAAEQGEVISDRQDTSYTSQVKANRSIQNRTGENDPVVGSVVEVVTEWTCDGYCTVFLPKHGVMLTPDGYKNPYEHKRISIAMLRYYPLPDEIIGESEAEPVLPLKRAIDAVLSGTIDEGNIVIQPPIKVASSGVRIETIEYGPGAKWIMQSPNLVEQVALSQGYLSNFNSLYPALVAAFNTAMGDSSLGVSNVRGDFTQKTATEVRSLATQQNNRDQYNQLYLSEFLKDIMMMWLSNNKQYLFDDPTKHTHIIKVIGQQNVKYFQQMMLDEMEVPDDAMQEIAGILAENPNAVTDAELSKLLSEVSVPKRPVITNPNEDPENYDIKPKLNVKESGEAELYMTPDDLDGEYDYVPDVQSMASGASEMAKDARAKALELALNPQVAQCLAQQGEKLNYKEIIISAFRDAGDRDPEGLFIPNEQSAGNLTGGQGTAQTGTGNIGIPPVGGLQNVPPTQDVSSLIGGLPPTELTGQGGVPNVQ